MRPDDRADLYAVTWRLTGIEDLTGQLPMTPTGGHALRFRYHNSDQVDEAPFASAGDDTGSHSRVVIERDRMQFGEWVNGLVGWYSAATVSPRAGMPYGPLSGEERQLVFSVLNGTASWSLHDGVLTLARPGMGSLTYVAEPGT